MDAKEPPSKDFLFLLPAKMIGFHIEEKRWGICFLFQIYKIISLQRKLYWTLTPASRVRHWLNIPGAMEHQHLQ